MHHWMCADQSGGNLKSEGRQFLVPIEQTAGSNANNGVTDTSTLRSRRSCHLDIIEETKKGQMATWWRLSVVLKPWDLRFATSVGRVQFGEILELGCSWHNPTLSRPSLLFSFSLCRAIVLSHPPIQATMNFSQPQSLSQSLSPLYPLLLLLLCLLCCLFNERSVLVSTP